MIQDFENVGVMIIKARTLGGKDTPEISPSLARLRVDAVTTGRRSGFWCAGWMIPLDQQAGLALLSLRGFDWFGPWPIPRRDSDCKTCKGGEP